MISIVVPIYNGEKYIEDCLKSILVQSYTQWELILIDNASTDDSLRICKEYAAKDDRIQVLHQYQNLGVSSARNLGMEKARGEFVTFVDIDDWIKTDYLEQLLVVQKKKNADMVICEYQKVYNNDRNQFKDILAKRIYGEIVEKRNDETTMKYQEKEYETKEYYEKYFLEGNTHCWGVLFERELLDGIFFPKGMSIGEDMLFLLDVSQRAKAIVVTNYSGYCYYINENGAMNKKFTSTYMDQIYCWEKALERISKVYPELIAKVESIVVVSILLVIGKLSQLDNLKKKEYCKEEMECYKTFLKYATKKGIMKYLPKGYPIKVLLYRYLPKLYLFLYGKLS